MRSRETKKKKKRRISIWLEITYDRVPREVIRHVIEKKHIHKWYIDAIKDMYGRVIPSAKIIRGEANTFPVTIGLHQGHALNPYLFTLTIDDITGDIRDEVRIVRYLWTIWL